MENSKAYRMAQIQIMNIVNVGIDSEISIENIYLMATACINATQLFLTSDEIENLRRKLKVRLEKAM